MLLPTGASCEKGELISVCRLRMSRAVMHMDPVGAVRPAG